MAPPRLLEFPYSSNTIWESKSLGSCTFGARPTFGGEPPKPPSLQLILLAN